MYEKETVFYIPHVVFHVKGLRMWCTGPPENVNQKFSLISHSHHIV